jgi:hypothetical protein
VSLSELDESQTEALLAEVGARWWYDYGDWAGARSPRRLRLVRVGAERPAVAPEKLARAAAAVPGGTWQIGNEPNVLLQDLLDPAAYATLYHDYYLAIKGADPSAKVLAGGVLSWDFTCTGCDGIPSGHEWTAAFWSAYRAQYGSDPPADGWAMHPYLIDWDNLPMHDFQKTIAQVSGMRSFLDAKGHTEAPIWLTEVGVIWGCEGIAPRPDGKVDCVNYRADLMEDYMVGVLEWLAAHAEAQHLEHWFWYVSAPRPETYATMFAGIALFEAKGMARPSRFGELYRRYSSRLAARSS